MTTLRKLPIDKPMKKSQTAAMRSMMTVESKRGQCRLSSPQMEPFVTAVYECPLRLRPSTLPTWWVRRR